MNELATNKTFQEKMFERIREDMGKFLSDEDLKSIVDQAMHKAFFEKQSVRGNYGHVDYTDPEFIVLMRKEMQSRVHVAMENWLEKNHDGVKRVIEETLEAGMWDMIRRHFQRQTEEPLQDLKNALINKGILQSHEIRL